MNKISVYVQTVFCACQVKIRNQTNNDLSEPGKSIKIWCKVEGNKIKQQKKELKLQSSSVEDIGGPLNVYQHVIQNSMGLSYFCNIFYKHKGTTRVIGADYYYVQYFKRLKISCSFMRTQCYVQRRQLQWRRDP